MPCQSDQSDEHEPGLAPDLVRALCEVHAPTILVPRLRDEAVLSDAASSLARRRFFASTGVRAVLAIAAMLLIAAGVQFTLARRPLSNSVTAPRLAADVDADGRVDIVDAMVLAAGVRGAGSGGRDINGDGVVDQRDVDAVAQLAVRLDRGGA